MREFDSKRRSALAPRVIPLSTPWRLFALSPAYRQAGELALAALAFLLYFVVRANVIERPELALANARQLIELERHLGIFVEPAWQHWALESNLLVRAFNLVYFWLDFPLISAVGLLMYVRRRQHYSFTRDAVLFSGALALVAYTLFPLAPPRLTPGTGVIDTLQAFNNLSYQAQSTQFFVNPYAAMPSLHVGWALLLAVGVAKAFPRSRVILAAAALHPLAQWASTVFTGNHFLLDGAGGLAAAGGGLALAIIMQRWGYTTLHRALQLSIGNRSGGA